MSDDETWDANRVRLRVSNDLAAISYLYAALSDEVVAKAGDPDMPGGDAMNMIGPAANLEAWENRYEAAEGDGFVERFDYAVDQIDTEEHPLLVLATWEDVVRDIRNQVSDRRANVGDAINYLRNSLDWMLTSDEYGNLNFPAIDQLGIELHKVRFRLETILRDGFRRETGAPCLHCRTPLERLQDKKYGLTDEYRCRKCGREYKKAAYDYAVGVTYLHNAPALTAKQIEERTGIPATKVRMWGCRYDGLKTGKRNPDGLLTYDVEAVIAKRDELEEAVPA